MKLEKRSEGAPEPQPSGQDKPGGRKPVIVYIMVLFIVAFVLMAASFLMHQRSNTEAIGKLNDSVTALQAVQATQDENIRLQKDLQSAQDENAQLRQKAQEQTDALTDSDHRLSAAQSAADALTRLYTLQQQYANRDFAGCRKTIDAMEQAGDGENLSDQAPQEGVTSPARRYQQLKDAVQGRPVS